jgi:hypothetical protein
LLTSNSIKWPITWLRVNYTMSYDEVLKLISTLHRDAWHYFDSGVAFSLNEQQLHKLVARPHFSLMRQGVLSNVAAGPFSQSPTTTTKASRRYTRSQIFLTLSCQNAGRPPLQLRPAHLSRARLHRQKQRNTFST